MREIPAFLLAGLKFNDPDSKLLRHTPDSEWKRVLADWHLVRLTLPLRQRWNSDLPLWVRQHIDASLTDNALRFERIKSAYSQAAMALEEARADHVVVKGFSLWPGYTDHPKFRPQSDIDLYCPPESVYRARDALLSLGYTTPHLNHVPSDHLSTLIPAHAWKWRGKFFDPEIPVSFELHFCWWDSGINRIYPEGLEEFWLRRIARTVDNLYFPGLDPVDNVGYTAINLLRHLLKSFPATEQVYGLARFLHLNAENRPFWQRWQETHHRSLRQLEAISFKLSSEWFGCSLPAEVQEEIQRLPKPVHAWFHHFLESTSSKSFEHRKDGMWLHLNLLDSRRDKFFIFLQRVAPVPIRVPTIRSVLGVERLAESSKGKNVLPHIADSGRKIFRYTKWLIARGSLHFAPLPVTLWRGVGYQLSRKNLSPQFWTFFAAAFCFDLGMTMYFFIYNLHLLGLGFDEKFLGLMVSAMNIGSIACTIPAGMLIQRIGIRKALLFCIAMVSTISVARAIFAPQFAILGLALLGGFFTTIWAVAISPALALLTDDESRPFGFSMVFSSGIAVGILGHLASSRLPGLLMRLSATLSEVQAKRIVLLMSAAIVALALVPLWRLRMEAPAPEAKPKLYPRNPFLLRYLPALALWSVVTGSLSPLATVYFSQHLHTSLVQMGNIFSVSSLIQVLGILAAPLLFRKLGIVSGLACSQLLAALLLGLLAATAGTLPAAVIYIVFTGFLWMGEPGMFSLLMGGVNPEERAGASALNFLVISLVQAGAVAATGASFARFGYPTVLRTVAVVALMAAVAFWVLLGRPPQLQAKSLSVNVDA
jgi:MFS family permease